MSCRISAAGIKITGLYANERVPGLIDEADPDVILIPSTWPETYCYTLSHALRSGRPAAGFDIGAIGTRLRAAARQGAPVILLPLDFARDPARLLAALQSTSGRQDAAPEVQRA